MILTKNPTKCDNPSYIGSMSFDHLSSGELNITFDFYKKPYIDFYHNDSEIIKNSISYLVTICLSNTTSCSNNYSTITFDTNSFRLGSIVTVLKKMEEELLKNDYNI